MAKTKAQRQREYRERLKTKDQNFLKRERQRVKQYYVPTSSLKIQELQERRKVTKKKVTKHREWLYFLNRNSLQYKYSLRNRMERTQHKKFRK